VWDLYLKDSLVAVSCWTFLLLFPFKFFSIRPKLINKSERAQCGRKQYQLSGVWFVRKQKKYSGFSENIFFCWCKLMKQATPQFKHVNSCSNTLFKQLTLQLSKHLMLHLYKRQLRESANIQLCSNSSSNCEQHVRKQYTSLYCFKSLGCDYEDVKHPSTIYIYKLILS